MKKEKSLYILLCTLLCTVVTVCVYFIFIEPMDITLDFFKEEKEKGPTLTQEVTYINIPTAKNIIENTTNLTIIDCRGGCKCSWKTKLPNAIWAIQTIRFYNSTNDLLIYCLDGTKSPSFAERLVGHVYGKIYNMDGGWNAWINYGR